MRYFSDEERGSRPRTEERLSVTVWNAIAPLIKSHVADGSFGYKYPKLCPDSTQWVIGCDAELFARAVRGDIPEMDWPPR